MNPVIDQKNELLSFAAEVIPLAVMVLIFDKVPLRDINVEMDLMLKAALPNCRAGKDKTRLSSFHEWQAVLFQALHSIYCEKYLPVNHKNNELIKLQEAFVCYTGGGKITNDVLNDPTLIIRELFKICPVHYALIRLWDWRDKGVSNDQVYSSEASRLELVYYYYPICTALIKAAHSLNSQFIP